MTFTWSRTTTRGGWCAGRTRTTRFPGTPRRLRRRRSRDVRSPAGRRRSSFCTTGVLAGYFRPDLRRTAPACPTRRPTVAGTARLTPDRRIGVAAPAHRASPETVRTCRCYSLSGQPTRASVARSRIYAVSASSTSGGLVASLANSKKRARSPLWVRWSSCMALVHAM